jgi:hypothetical protein
MQFTKAIQPAGAVGEPGMQPVPTASLARQPSPARGMRDSPDGRQLAEPQISARLIYFDLKNSGRDCRQPERDDGLDLLG